MKVYCPISYRTQVLGNIMFYTKYRNHQNKTINQNIIRCYKLYYFSNNILFNFEKRIDKKKIEMFNTPIPTVINIRICSS